MRSEKQTNASRTNGKKSRGPISPAGKRISARNAERHGLLSQSIVMEGEDKERFHALLARLVSEHLPQTDSELELVETMAVAKWRQKRVWDMETARMSHEIRTQARDPELAAHTPVVRAALAFESVVDRSRSLSVLSRYEVRFDRIYIRAKRELRESRK
ncbi:MAG: hypothetical protein ABSB15_25725 [Bryobacteraceae bacterium]|jgi:hypothetical protein